jgi:hypothetical protein
MFRAPNLPGNLAWFTVILIAHAKKESTETRNDDIDLRRLVNCFHELRMSTRLQSYQCTFGRRLTTPSPPASKKSLTAFGSSKATEQEDKGSLQQVYPIPLSLCPRH